MKPNCGSGRVNYSRRVRSFQNEAEAVSESSANAADGCAFVLVFVFGAPSPRLHVPISFYLSSIRFCFPDFIKCGKWEHEK